MEWPEVQGHPQPRTECEARTGYVKPSAEGQQQKNKIIPASKTDETSRPVGGRLLSR